MKMENREIIVKESIPMENREIVKELIPTRERVTESIPMETEPKAKRGYVTFLAGNGDYVKGVVGLAKGLRKAKSEYPFVVAVLPDVPDDHRKILESQGCIVREIEPVYPPENHTQFAMAYYVINYSKLRIWEVSYGQYIFAKSFWRPCSHFLFSACCN